MKTPRLLSLCIAMTLSAPAVASAQDEGIFSEENLRLVTTIGVLSTTSTVYMLIEAFSDRMLDRMFENVSLHLQENAVALQQDVSTGGGDALTDLGRLYDLGPGEIAVFSRRARSRRAAILPLLRGERLTRAEVLYVTKVLLSKAQYARLRVR